MFTGLIITVLFMLALSGYGSHNISLDDDAPDIVYSAGWSVVGSPGYFGGSYHQTTMFGATAQLDFVGMFHEQESFFQSER